MKKLDQKQICTASSGNHGFAVSYASKLLGFNAKVFVPVSCDASKVENIRNVMNADIELVGDNCLVAELEAKKYAQQAGIPYISPYNDQDVVNGNGTVAVEIVEQVKELVDGGKSNGLTVGEGGSNVRVYVSVGGGGLIGGMSTYLKHVWPKCTIVGCQPENSAVMYYSSLAGKILSDVKELDTISDGTAGGIEEDAITFEICQQFVDRYVLVSEEEIIKAMKHLLFKERLLVEGAAACALSCLQKDMETLESDNVISVVLLCGRNVAKEKIIKLASY